MTNLKCKPREGEGGRENKNVNNFEEFWGSLAEKEEQIVPPLNHFQFQISEKVNSSFTLEKNDHFLLGFLPKSRRPYFALWREVSVSF